MRRTATGLVSVLAKARPPEIAEIESGSDWKFETKALADEFRHFEVKALADNSATISIFDYIGDDGEGGGVGSKRIAAALRSLVGKPITVEINSPGGNYFEGVSIYNLLRRHDAPITVQVLGIAASAASVIAMAGDVIQIAHNAEIMIHQAMGVVAGNADEMEDSVATLRKLDRAMADTYAARTGLNVDDLLAMMKAETFIGGQDAVEKGFADALMEREAQMPVYAEAEDFPTDQATLDKFLAKQNMPRSARRDLFRAIKPGTPRADGSATPNAGTTDGQDFGPLIKALSLS